MEKAVVVADRQMEAGERRRRGIEIETVVWGGDRRGKCKGKGRSRGEM